MQDLCSRDLLAAKVWGSDLGKMVVVASGYFPYDARERLPSLEVQRLVTWSSAMKASMILGCDANAHNLCQGNSDTNVHGESLLDYIVSSRLQIIRNVGNELTFLNRMGVR